MVQSTTKSNGEPVLLVLSEDEWNRKHSCFHEQLDKAHNAFKSIFSLMCPDVNAKLTTLKTKLRCTAIYTEKQIMTCCCNTSVYLHAANIFL